MTRLFVAATVAILSLAAGQAQAMDARSLTVASSACAARHGALRVAYHPGQAPLRCARFLPTTRLPHGQPPLHT